MYTVTFSDNEAGLNGTIKVNDKDSLRAVVSLLRGWPVKPGPFSLCGKWEWGSMSAEITFEREDGAPSLFC